MIGQEPAIVQALQEKSLEERGIREDLLRQNPDQFDERTPVEKLLECILTARLAFYRPAEIPSVRRDILCLCCGHLYRPDDPMDAENVFICLSCIGERKGL